MLSANEFSFLKSVVIVSVLAAKYKCDFNAEARGKRVDRERERIASQLEEAKRQSNGLLMKVMHLPVQNALSSLAI